MLYFFTDRNLIDGMISGVTYADMLIAPPTIRKQQKTSEVAPSAVKSQTSTVKDNDSSSRVGRGRVGGRSSGYYSRRIGN